MTRRVIRWAVGSPGGTRSSPWRLWSNKKGDIYAAVRSLGGTVKASFHRDGKCHVGFTSEYAATATARFGVARRHWETWRLPADPVARVLQILIPFSDLRLFATLDDAELTWLPAPPMGSIAVVSIVVAPPDAELCTPEGSSSTHIVGTVRTSLRNAWAFYAHNPIDESLARTITLEREKLKDVPVPSGLPPGTRAMIWDSRADHDRKVLELAHDGRPTSQDGEEWPAF